MSRNSRQKLYQTYGEFLRYHYQALKRRDQGNPALLSDAIRMWKKYKQQGGNAGLADRKISELEDLKREAR